MHKYPHPTLSRRQFLKVGGGMLGALAGSAVLSKVLLKPDQVSATPLRPARPVSPAPQAADFDLHLVATDGWAYLPETATVPPYFPDDMGPAVPGGPNLNCYIFGFRDATHYDQNNLSDLKMGAQFSGPIFSVDEVDVADTDPSKGFRLKLTNLGLKVRPDLIDSHTLHFHGFRNALPIFDGEPHSSVGVPIIRDLMYYYRPHNPGTYLYHCHFEETEHVHMGMIGMVYVKPLLNQANPGHKYAYNDPATEYDREFTFVLNEVWALAHWCDSHIQLPDWTDYKPEFFTMNGRCYPDTIAPNGTINADSTLTAPDGRPELVYQPISSLIKVNAGDRVLLRVSNIGFLESTLAISCGKMHVIGKDASLLKNDDGTDLTYWTNTETLGTGESRDILFTAPDYHGSGGQPDRYLFYNTNPARLVNGGHKGYGGQMTEIHVYPPDTLAPQSQPNT